MNFIKLFENFDKEETIKDILVDWYDYRIELIKHNKKLYIFIIHPNILMSHVDYFKLDNEKVNDLDRIISYIEYDKYKLSNFFMMPSIYLNDEELDDLLFKIEHSKTNNYYKPDYYINLNKLEELSISHDNNTPIIKPKYDNYPMNNIAIGYLLLIFDKQ